MVKVKTSAGQILVERIEKFIGRYIHFACWPSEQQALIVALWCIQTWMTEYFPMTPFLHISAELPGSGKTTLLEMCALLTRQPLTISSVRPLAVCRWAESMSGGGTLLIDQAEKLNSKGDSEEVSLLASAYRKGGQHMITSGEKSRLFATFTTMAFAGIGDLCDVLRTRCLVIYLEPGRVAGDYVSEMGTAALEAGQIKAELLTAFTKVPKMVMPEFVSGRDREIMTPLWSLALALGFDDAMLARLVSGLVDMADAKRLPARQFHNPEARDIETGAHFGVLAVKALQAVCAALPERQKYLSSAAAVDALRAIPEGRWRNYGGRVGLTENSLADLLSRFKLLPEVRHMGKHAVTKKPVKARGYVVAEIAGVRL